MFSTSDTFKFPFAVYDNGASPRALANADSTPAGTLVVNGSDVGTTVTVTNPATGRYIASVALSGLSVGDIFYLRVSVTKTPTSGSATTELVHSQVSRVNASIGSVTVGDKTGFKLASDGLAGVTAWTADITGSLSGSVGSVTDVTNITPYPLSVGSNGIANVNLFQLYDSELSAEILSLLMSSIDAHATPIQDITDAFAAVFAYYADNTSKLPPVASVSTVSNIATAVRDVTVTGAAAGGIGDYIVAASTSAAEASGYAQNIIAKLGAFTGSGINTVLGFFKALFRSDASTPSDIGGTFDPATDSTQAIRDRGDTAWITATGFATSSALTTMQTDVTAIKAKTDNLPNAAMPHTSGKLHVLDGSGNAVAPEADVNEIHDVTNKLETMLVEVGSNPGFWQWTEESHELVDVNVTLDDDDVDAIADQINTTGNGDIPVNHNYGGTDELQILEVDTDDPIDDATITAIVDGAIVAQTRTGSDGRWVADLMLDAGTYTINVSKANQIEAYSFTLEVEEA